MDRIRGSGVKLHLKTLFVLHLLLSLRLFRLQEVLAPFTKPAAALLDHGKGIRAHVDFPSTRERAVPLLGRLSDVVGLLLRETLWIITPG